MCFSARLCLRTAVVQSIGTVLACHPVDAPGNGLWLVHGIAEGVVRLLSSSQVSVQSRLLYEDVPSICVLLAVSCNGAFCSAALRAPCCLAAFCSAAFCKASSRSRGMLQPRQLAPTLCSPTLCLLRVSVMRVRCCKHWCICWIGACCTEFLGRWGRTGSLSMFC